MQPVTRTSCVCWLLEAYSNERVFHPEVFHASVALFDEFLGRAAPRGDMLLYLATCARLAEKFLVTSDECTSSAIWGRRLNRKLVQRAMNEAEREVLATVGWQVWVPHLGECMQEVAEGCSEATRAVAWLVADAGITRPDWAKHALSDLAAACVLIGCAATGGVASRVGTPSARAVVFLESSISWAMAARLTPRWSPLWRMYCRAQHPEVAEAERWVRTWLQRQIGETGIYPRPPASGAC
jgi:hypothetical protein